MKADYDLEERLLEYSARIIRLVKRLADSWAVQGSRFGVRLPVAGGRGSTAGL